MFRAVVNGRNRNQRPKVLLRVLVLGADLVVGATRERISLSVLGTGPIRRELGRELKISCAVFDLDGSFNQCLSKASMSWA